MKSFVGLVSILLGAIACVPAGQDNALPREGFVAVGGGVRLYYRVLGSGPDTAIVVHGGPGAGMNSVLADFRPLSSDLTLIFYDQRGGGRSTLPADTTQLDARYHVADLDAVRAYFGLERLQIIAHSFGAIVVARYAEMYPDRVERIVLHGATGPVRAEAARVAQAAPANPDTALSRRSSALLGELLDGSAADPVGTCRRWEEIGRRLATRNGETTEWSGTVCDAPPEAVRYYFRYTAQLSPRTFGDWDFTTQLAQVRAPVLVVAGEGDSLALAAQRRWAESYPNGQLFTVPAVGKAAIAEDPDRVVSAIASFLTE